MATWIEPGKGKQQKQTSLRSSVKKKRHILVKDGKSFTRYEEDGMIRSTECPHGPSCRNFGAKDVKSCFVAVS